jgi:hypothetical protein
MGNKCLSYINGSDAKFGSVNLNDSRHAMIITSKRKGVSVQDDGTFYRPRTSPTPELDCPNCSNSKLITIHEDQ